MEEIIYKLIAFVAAVIISIWSLTRKKIIFTNNYEQEKYTQSA